MTADPLVILLEDDEGLREALSLVLRSHGFRVTGADLAADAVALLEEEPPHAVVADLGLPDARGTAGARTVDSLRAAAPDARLVVLTGRQEPSLRDACLQAGADAFVVKPTSGAELADLLRCSPG